eukprot:TRINITY_DN61353_c0_g1_i1.p1 TRINITY_DN61353_c0_g1~~TRINITY_DN61353_c0_g1_i1.p1  ORF type:complete len:1062 (-),score=130.75 TRINITY_DN61353_c0_g1_i1:394-3516(-)
MESFEGGQPLCNEAALGSTFDELKLDSRTIEAVHGAWYVFINSMSSREYAGELLLNAVCESSPTLQSMFTSLRALQALRFINAVASLVMALEDPPKLKNLVEALGFAHLNMPITRHLVTEFRDIVLDFFATELGPKLSLVAADGWRSLLSYVGGAILFCKDSYGGRIETLTISWAKANPGTTKADVETSKLKTEGMHHCSNGDAEHSEAKGKHEMDTAAEQSIEIPKNFPDMFRFNAAVMGVGDRQWMNEVLACFHNLVTNFGNVVRVQEECEVLSMRINTLKEIGIKLAEFKNCMLASLRSLLPGTWDTAHEQAWSWLWETVEDLVTKSPFFIRGLALERGLSKFFDIMTDDESFAFRADTYTEFFRTSPGGQSFFKQSNAYLHIIASKALQMSLGFYRRPVEMIDELSALGLRHVGYAIPVEYFSPFVVAFVTVMKEKQVDTVAVESLECSMGLVAKMLVRTVTEGSTLVMRAINVNSKTLTMRSVATAPRGTRAQWMLIVQVGTQDISPLGWAIQSGAEESASAMITDLLTIRADRDRYYYAMDALCTRHPDLIKMLVDEAPALLPVMLNGLIWRSHISEGGMRRVNYYIHHLLVDAEGEPAMAISWVATTLDPKIARHPIMVLVNDVAWRHLVCESFVLSKLWLFFTIVVFMASQDRNLARHPEAVFVCRCFVYICGMGLLIYRHTKSSILSFQAGDMMAVLCIWVPGYLRKWSEICSFGVTCSLFIMFCLEPILQCWGRTEDAFASKCSSAGPVMSFAYSFGALTAMFMYWMLLVDLSILSERVASYVLICGKLMSELGLYLIAWAVLTLVFASAICCLKENAEIHNIPAMILFMFELVMGIGVTDDVKELGTFITVMVYICFIAVAIFLTDILIAQLHNIYSSSFYDMVGLARLGRLSVIADALPKVSKKRWSCFLDRMEFDKKLEFNEGDIGVAGGMQVVEPASANPVTTDQIMRFGGSTSPGAPWPEADTEGDDRLDRLERLLQNLAKTLNLVGNRRPGSSHNSADCSNAPGEPSSSLDERGGGNSDSINLG